MSDKDPVADLDCLETALFLNVPETDGDADEEEEEGVEENGGDEGDRKGKIDYGGYVSFVARNEKEEVSS
jgi:hypothetical protein